MSSLPGSAVVVGASRGLGLGIAETLAEGGVQVVAVSRTVPSAAHRGIRLEKADAAQAATAEAVIREHVPGALVLVAGATPIMLPLQEQTWDSFSRNWNADVQIAFRWLQAALRQPLKPGSRVVVISSGAALNGSPLSGGYAGAKATQRFITRYAREEAERAGLGITFTAVLPGLTPMTDLGRPAVAAYAERAGQSEPEFVARMGAPLTPSVAGTAVAEILAADDAGPEYLLTAAGLRALT